MIRSLLSRVRFDATVPAAPLALVLGLALAAPLSGCSVSWRSSAGYSKGSTNQTSGAERPQATQREPRRRAPSGRDNVERVTVGARPVATPSQPSSRADSPSAGTSQPNVPAATAPSSGQSGSPVPTPESTSPVVPPAPATPAVPATPTPTPVPTEPDVKTADKVENAPHYAPRSERKPTKRSREAPDPKQNRNREGGDTTPSAPKTDRTR